MKSSGSASEKNQNALKRKKKTPNGRSKIRARENSAEKEKDHAGRGQWSSELWGEKDRPTENASTRENWSKWCVFVAVFNHRLRGGRISHIVVYPFLSLSIKVPAWPILESTSPTPGGEIRDQEKWFGVRRGDRLG